MVRGLQLAEGMLKTTVLWSAALALLIGVQGCGEQPSPRVSTTADSGIGADKGIGADSGIGADNGATLDARPAAADRSASSGDLGPEPDLGPAPDGGPAPDQQTTPPDTGGPKGPTNPIDPSLPLIWSSEVLGIDKTGPTKRWSIGKAPDGKQAVVFSIFKGTPVVATNNSVTVDKRAVKKLIAETDWWFQAGYAHPSIGQKLWGVFGGCGACGGETCNRAPHSSPDVTNAEFEGGWSLRNLVGSSVKWVRAYAYSRNRYDLGGQWAPSTGKLFGKTFGGLGTSYPKGYDGAWMKISLVLQMNSPKQANGWLEIYLDRKLVRRKEGVLWQYDPAKVKGLLYRISHMYGGTPASDPPIKDQKEWARDARIWASFY